MVPHEQAAQNTDREIWREDDGDYYAASIFVTQVGGGIGIDVGGHVIVKPVREWHALAGGWRPIETAPKGRKLIVGYRNELGNWRSVMGCFYAASTLDANTDYIDGDEDGFAPEGWYEEGEAYSEALLPTDKAPTHWMPLPAEPQA